MHKSSAVIVIVALFALSRGWYWYHSRIGQCNNVSVSNRVKNIRVSPTTVMVSVTLPHSSEIVQTPEEVYLCGSKYVISLNQKEYYSLKPYLSSPVDLTVVGFIVKDKGLTVLQVESVKSVVPKVKSNNWYTELKSGIQSRIVRGLPEPHGSLLVGLLLGDQGSFSSKFKDQMLMTGTYHLAAASGYNVSVVAAILLSIISRSFSRRTQIVIVIIGGWLYVLLAGASPSLVRAMLMFSTVHVGLLFGRQALTQSALVLSVSLMLLVYPVWWVDLGTWLSFGATLGILTFVPWISTIGREVGRGFGMREPIVLAGWIKAVVEALTTSLSATLGIVPIAILVFGKLSLIGVAATALVSMMIPPLTVLGIAKAVFGGVLGPIGSSLGYLAWTFLEAMVVMIEYLAQFGGPVIEIDSVESLWGNQIKIVVAVGYYLILMYIGGKHRLGQR